jgi:23S rRNA G2069 N7-methylase RlmK/C1962 C5-methylase RlmI
VRAWSFDEAERIDAAFFERRIARAVALRARLPIESATACAWCTARPTACPA